MLKNQVEVTWCNSRSWWVTDAGGLTGSRSPRPCPSPYWTGDGRPHSYQCRSTVKGINHCNWDTACKCSIAKPTKSTKGWCCILVNMLHFLWIEVITTFSSPPRPTPTGVIVQKHTEIRFLLSTLSRGSWNSVNSQHEDGYQQWKERSPWFCCHSEHLIMRGGN